MSNWNPNAGGYPPPQGPAGGGYPPQGPGYPPQGGFPPQGVPGGYPQPGGYPGSPPPGYGGQPPGFGGQPGFGGPGFGQQGFGPSFPSGQPPKRRSNALIIGIVVASVLVLGLVGLGIAALKSGDNKAVPNVPVPTPPSPAGSTQPGASPTPRTSTPTPASPPSGNALPIGSGMSVTPAPGWEVVKQESDLVVLRDQRGRAMAFQGGRSSDVRADVESLLTDATAKGSNVRKGEIRTVPLDSRLNVASQNAVMTSTSGGGSSELGVFVLVSARVSDNLGFGAVLFAPSNDLDNKELQGQVSSMLDSVIRTQLQ